MSSREFLLRTKAMLTVLGNHSLLRLWRQAKKLVLPPADIVAGLLGDGSIGRLDVPPACFRPAQPQPQLQLVALSLGRTGHILIDFTKVVVSSDLILTERSHRWRYFTDEKFTFIGRNAEFPWAAGNAASVSWCRSCCPTWFFKWPRFEVANVWSNRSSCLYLIELADSILIVAGSSCHTDVLWASPFVRLHCWRVTAKEKIISKCFKKSEVVLEARHFQIHLIWKWRAPKTIFQLI